MTIKKPFVISCLSFVSNLLRQHERERERERDREGERERDVTWKKNSCNETFAYINLSKQIMNDVGLYCISNVYSKSATLT